MAEYTTVSTGHEITYQGYLDLQRLSKLIRELLIKRGYVYLEVEHNEVIHKNGKDIYLRSDNDKELSADIKSRILVDITAKDLTNVTVDIDDKTKHVQEATVTINVSAYIISDYEGRYQKNAWLYFLRNIYEKFIGVRELTKFKHIAQRDHDDIINEAKRFLNLTNL